MKKKTELKYYVIGNSEYYQYFFSYKIILWSTYLCMIIITSSFGRLNAFTARTYRIDA